MRDEKKIVRKVISVRLPEWQIKEINKIAESRKKKNLTIDTIQDVFEFAVTEFIQKHGD